MKEPDIHELVELGLNRYEASAYVALLERGEFAPAALAQRAGIPRQRIYDVLESLERNGFCALKSSRPRRYGAVNPNIALDHHLRSKDAALRDELERTRSLTGAAIARLLPFYEAGAQEDDPFQYVEVLRTPLRIAARSLEVARTASSHVDSFVKLPLILDDEQNIRFIHEPLSRGVAYRSIYETSALDDPEVWEFARSCAELGQEIRVSDHVPVKMHCFDSTTALLSLQDPVGGSPSFTALLVHHPGLAEVLDASFQALWKNARPYSFAGDKHHGRNE